MIRLTEALNVTGEALPLLRIRALWECYGPVPFIRFYQGDRGSAIAVLDGQATVWATDDEREEVALFIGMQPEIRAVTADVLTAESVAEQWSVPMQTVPVMRCETPQRAEGLAHASPRELYAFLEPIFPGLPPFEGWYMDVCYRERHGACRNVTIVDGDLVVSAAMTTAEWHGGALIGGVATDPRYRRQGMAARCVGALAADLQQEQRQVYICPKTEGAQRIYTALGFVVCDRLALVERSWKDDADIVL